MTAEDAVREYIEAEEAGLVDLLVAEAVREGLPPAFVLAVASRELLSESESERDGGCRKVPEGMRVLIGGGCGRLARAHAWAKWLGLGYKDALQFAAAAYNAGMENVLRGMAEGDADRYTAGGSYGGDVVWGLMPYFEGLMPRGGK